jgi:integrase
MSPIFDYDRDDANDPDLKYVPITPEQLSRALAEVAGCEACGPNGGEIPFEDFRWHDWRHTFASHMIMAGADLSTVQMCLGHSQQTMTQRYAHLALNHIRKAVRMLDKVFSGGAPSQEGQPVHQGQNSLQAVDPIKDTL